LVVAVDYTKAGSLEIGIRVKEQDPNTRKVLNRSIVHYAAPKYKDVLSAMVNQQGCNCLPEGKSMLRFLQQHVTDKKGVVAVVVARIEPRQQTFCYSPEHCLCSVCGIAALRKTGDFAAAEIDIADAKSALDVVK